MASKLPSLGTEECSSRPQTGNKRARAKSARHRDDLPVTHRLRLQILKDQYAYLFTETNWTDERLREMKRKYGISFGLKDVEISKRWGIIFEKCSDSSDPSTILHVWNECCNQQLEIKMRLEFELKREVDNYIKPLTFYRAIGARARDEVGRYIVKNADQTTTMLAQYYKEMNASFEAGKQYMESVALQMHNVLGDSSYEPMDDIETLYGDIKESMDSICGVIDSLNFTVKDKNREISDLRCHITDHLQRLEDERDAWKKKAESILAMIDQAVERGVQQAMAPLERKLDEKMKKIDEKMNKLDKLDEISDKLDKLDEIDGLKSQLAKLTTKKEPGDPNLRGQYKDRLSKDKVTSAKKKKTKSPDKTQI